MPLRLFKNLQKKMYKFDYKVAQAFRLTLKVIVARDSRFLLDEEDIEWTGETKRDRSKDSHCSAQGSLNHLFST